MPTMTLTPAAMVSRMVEAIQNDFPPEELVEIHDSIFRKDHYGLEAAQHDSEPLIQKLVAYFTSGLYPERVASLWPMVFPGFGDVWYDEEEDVIRYSNYEREPSWEE